MVFNRRRNVEILWFFFLYIKRIKYVFVRMFIKPFFLDGWILCLHILFNIWYILNKFIKPGKPDQRWISNRWITLSVRIFRLLFLFVFFWLLPSSLLILWLPQFVGCHLLVNRLLNHVFLLFDLILYICIKLLSGAESSLLQLYEIVWLSFLLLVKVTGQLISLNQLSVFIFNRPILW